AAKVLRPERVRLVLQHLAAHERERLLERAPSEVRRLSPRALEQLVEAVEIELDSVGGEAVRLCLRADKLAGALPLRDEMTAEHGDESLERAGRVLGQLFSPKQLGEAIGRHSMSARGEQDLENLLRAGAAQVAWAERAGAVFDRKYSEESDHHPLPTLLTSGHAHLRFERPPSAASSPAG